MAQEVFSDMNYLKKSVNLYELNFKNSRKYTANDKSKISLKTDKNKYWFVEK